MKKVEKGLPRIPVITVDEHICKHIEKSNIVIAKFQSEQEEGWYWIFRGRESHGICYCPYCGEELK